MKQNELFVPAMMITAAVIALFAPGLEPIARGSIFAVAVICATTFAILSNKSRDAASATQWKVSLQEISFVHYERPRADRPSATEDVTSIYDEAKDLFHAERYEEAARAYQRAFVLGNDYWPAKVNEGMSYQALGHFDLAFAAYDDVILRCQIPRFRRQSLGNSGDILKRMAEAAEKKEEADKLLASALEKYIAAYATERTFVSTYNLWEISDMLGFTGQAAGLLNELRSYPEYEQLSPDQKPDNSSKT